jgi:hypothetical protein
MRAVGLYRVHGVLLFALTACGGGTGPDDPGLLATVDYAPRGAAAGAQPPPDYEGTAAVSAEAGTLRFTTTIYSDLCRTSPKASIAQAGAEVTFSLRLEAQEGDANCLQWIAETDVTALTRELPPGHYTAKVRVEYPMGSVQVLDAGSAIIE